MIQSHAKSSYTTSATLVFIKVLLLTGNSHSELEIIKPSSQAYEKTEILIPIQTRVKKIAEKPSDGQ